MIEFKYVENVNSNEDVVQYRVDVDSDCPGIQVFLDGKWQNLVWMNNCGTLGLGYFTPEEQQRLPFQFQSNGTVRILF